MGIMGVDVTYLIAIFLYEVIYLISVIFTFKMVFRAEKSKHIKRNSVATLLYIVILVINYISQYLITLQKKTVLLLVLAFFINVLYLFKTAIFLYFMYGKNNIIGFSCFYTMFNYLISYTLCAAFCEIMQVEQTEILVTVCNIITSIIILISILILAYKKKNNKLSYYLISVSNREYCFISLFLLFMYIVEIGIFNSFVFSLLKGVMITLAFLLLFIIIYVFIIKEKNMSIENMLIVLEEQMKTITNYYYELRNKDEEIRRFRHDIKNLLYILNNMLSNNKTEEARDYITKMIGTFNAVTARYNTGCYIADAILSSKQKEAEEINTEIKINGPIPENSIKDVDMVILMSNLLDNAIEACAKIEGKKEIVLDSYIKINKWILKISNPVIKKPIIVNNRIMTTKENKNIHGIGILNIQRIVEKYAGNILFISDEKQFEVEMFLMTERCNNQ